MEILSNGVDIKESTPHGAFSFRTLKKEADESITFMYGALKPLLEEAKLDSVSNCIKFVIRWENCFHSISEERFDLSVMVRALQHLCSEISLNDLDVQENARSLLEALLRSEMSKLCHSARDRSTGPKYSEDSDRILTEVYNLGYIRLEETFPVVCYIMKILFRLKPRYGFPKRSLLFMKRSFEFLCQSDFADDRLEEKRQEIETLVVSAISNYAYLVGMYEQTKLFTQYALVKALKSPIDMDTLSILFYNFVNSKVRVGDHLALWDGRPLPNRNKAFELLKLTISFMRKARRANPAGLLTQWEQFSFYSSQAILALYIGMNHKAYTYAKNAILAGKQLGYPPDRMVKESYVAAVAKMQEAMVLIENKYYGQKAEVDETYLSELDLAKAAFNAISQSIVDFQMLCTAMMVSQRPKKFNYLLRPVWEIMLWISHISHYAGGDKLVVRKQQHEALISLLKIEDEIWNTVQHKHITVPYLIPGCSVPELKGFGDLKEHDLLVEMGEEGFIKEIGSNQKIELQPIGELECLKQELLERRAEELHREALNPNSLDETLKRNLTAVHQFIMDFSISFELSKEGRDIKKISELERVLLVSEGDYFCAYKEKFAKVLRETQPFEEGSDVLPLDFDLNSFSIENVVTNVLMEEI